MLVGGDCNKLKDEVAVVVNGFELHPLPSWTPLTSFNQGVRRCRRNSTGEQKVWFTSVRLSTRSTTSGVLSLLCTLDGPYHLS